MEDDQEWLTVWIWKELKWPVSRYWTNNCLAGLRENKNTAPDIANNAVWIKTQNLSTYLYSADMLNMLGFKFLYRFISAWMLCSSGLLDPDDGGSMLLQKAGSNWLVDTV
jgi:hypothetical protein